MARQKRMTIRQNTGGRRFAGACLVAVMALVSVVAFRLGGGGVESAPAFAATGCAAAPNPIVCENALPGAPRSAWDVGSGAASIQGFATHVGVQAGDTLQLKVDTPASAYHADIYRLGWYGGLGARLIATIHPVVALPQKQPACLSNAAVGLVDCGNWTVSMRWTVPSDAVSGVYEAKLVRDDGVVAANRVMFVVRNDASTSPILASTSDETWVAYNTYGGSNLYFGTTSAPNGRAYKVSYNRPLLNAVQYYDKRNTFFNAEYPMVRWLERNGYNVSYTTNVDTVIAPQRLLQHRVFLTMGHNEYVSREERGAMNQARANGVDLASFTANEVYWKTRWESSIAPDAQPYTTEVCYKESNAGRKIDPSPLWTGLWRDTRFSPPSDSGPPENELTGTIFGSALTPIRDIHVPAQYAKLRFWRDTSVASLQPGQSLTLAPGTLGWEFDLDGDNGWRPKGLMDLTSTTMTVHHRTEGLAWSDGPATNHATLYRAASGALVFSAGTIRWSWGLDPIHDEQTPASRADPNIQQATMNLLADMHVQPATPQAGLVVTAASTDTTPPTATITSPATGAAIAAGTKVTISGRATDSGGVVAAVEVSTNGTRWHPATGMANWTYQWTAVGSGKVTIYVRATDDSGNTQPTPTTRSITVT